MDSGNRSMEEEKMVRMLDNIVDELKPYYQQLIDEFIPGKIKF